MGFQSCSRKMTMSAAVRLRPRPPTCVVSSITGMEGSELKRCTTENRADASMPPSNRRKLTCDGCGCWGLGGVEQSKGATEMDAAEGEPRGTVAEKAKGAPLQHPPGTPPRPSHLCAHPRCPAPPAAPRRPPKKHSTCNRPVIHATHAAWLPPGSADGRGWLHVGVQGNGGL